jgi:hypothetical protein
MAVTMMVVAAVAEAASVAPMVRAKANSQPHPNPQQYYRYIPFWNNPPMPHNHTRTHNNISFLFHFGIFHPYPIICLILHT